MLEGKKHYSVNTVFPFVASFIDGSIRLEANDDLTSVNVLCTDTVNKVLVDHRDVRWVRGRHSRLKFEIKEFKRVFQKVFVPRCTSGSHTLQFHVLDHLVADLERF